MKQEQGTEFSMEQMEAIYPPGTERHYWSRARNWIIIDMLKSSIPPSMKMLEIGCGRGVVLEAVRAEGYECYGVDAASLPDSTGREYISYGKNFTELDPSFRASIEVVLLFDVIEHIKDDQAFLDSIRAHFPNLKYCVVTVPACMSLWSNFDVFNGHFRRYSIVTLRDLVRRSRFSIPAESYFFHMLYMPARVYSWLNITRETVMRVPAKGLMSCLHRLVALFLFGEYKILPRHLRGSSIIMVLEVIN
jgi:hypothetical protein